MKITRLERHPIWIFGQRVIGSSIELWGLVQEFYATFLFLCGMNLSGFDRKEPGFEPGSFLIHFVNSIFLEAMNGF